MSDKESETALAPSKILACSPLVKEAIDLEREATLIIWTINCCALVSCHCMSRYAPHKTLHTISPLVRPLGSSCNLPNKSLRSLSSWLLSVSSWDLAMSNDKFPALCPHKALLDPSSLVKNLYSL